MKHKLFGAIRGEPNFHVVVEYENSKIIRIHYSNEKALRTTDIILLKNSVSGFDYLVCTFSNCSQSYAIEYAADVIMTHDKTWDYSRYMLKTCFDLNMDKR